MTDDFFTHPILNSPYDCPARHWELDARGQPTTRIVDDRRIAEFITPIPKPKKRKSKGDQAELPLGDSRGLSSAEQQYEETAFFIKRAAPPGGPVARVAQPQRLEGHAGDGPAAPTLAGPSVRSRALMRGSRTPRNAGRKSTAHPLSSSR